MLISELAKILKAKGDLNVRLRHSKFQPSEYIIFVDEEYPNFFSPEIGGELIEWYPSLEDLMADDWEIIKVLPSMNDLQNLKRILDNARVPYYVEPVKTAPGYTIIRTAHTHYTFNPEGVCCEVVQI